MVCAVAEASSVVAGEAEDGADGAADGESPMLAVGAAEVSPEAVAALLCSAVRVARKVAEEREDDEAQGVGLPEEVLATEAAALPDAVAGRVAAAE